MKTDKRNQLAESAMPFLEPFQSVETMSLLDVLAHHVDDDIAIIYLKFESKCLEIEIDTNDDTLNLHSRPSPPEGCQTIALSQPWKKYVGQTFGWGWISLNQQGYLDSISLSFGEVVPEISLSARASAFVISSHIPHSMKFAVENDHRVAA